VDVIRNKEDIDDSQSKQKMPKQLHHGYTIEQQAAEIYNRNIFIKFMNELKQTERYKYRETEKGRCYEVWYKSNQIQERHRIRKYIVVTDLTEGREEFRCICAKFNKDGIFCTHILKVIVEEEVKKIPEKYFINRWRKNERKITLQSPQQTSNTNELLRFNMISRQAALLASKGAKKQIASQYMCDEFQRIDKQLDIILAESEETTASAIRIENTEAVSEHESSRNNEGEIVALKDPDRIQQKGRPKKPKRLKSMVEQEREKMRKAEEKKKNKKPANASASKYRFIEHSSSLKKELQKNKLFEQINQQK
jgi:hypothetical protein